MSAPHDSDGRTTSRSEFASLTTKSAESILAYLNGAFPLRGFMFWNRGARDPELRKILGRIHAAIGAAQDLDTATRHGLGEEGRGRVSQLLASDPRQLGLDAALEVVDMLDQVLIDHGDERYLRSLLAVEFARDRIDTTATTWSVAFGQPPTNDEVSLIQAGTPLDGTHLSAIRNQLAALYRTRSILYNLHRARESMKSHHLLLLAPVLLVLLAAFAAALYVAGESLSSIALALVAGALGGSLSGTLKVRDHVRTINDLRDFSPSVVVQPLIGATAGLLLLAVLNSRLVTVNWGGPAWATASVIAFVGGFSEPFFLGIVGRVAAIGESRAAGQTPPARVDPATKNSQR